MSLTTLKDKVEQLIEKAQSGDGKPEQEKSVDIVKNGTTEVLPDKGNTLSKVLINVEVPTAGGTEELGALIDESGVLDSTDGTATEKVEQLIDLAVYKKIIQEGLYANPNQMHRLFNNLPYPQVTDFDFSQTNVMGYMFTGNTAIEIIDIDVINAWHFQDWINGCKNLKTVILRNFGKNTTKDLSLVSGFAGCPMLEHIETLDFSKVKTSAAVNNIFGGSNAIKTLKIVPETIEISITIPSPVLSAESIQSIIDGLAVLVVGATRTLTLHADAKIMQSQVDSANAKGWTIAGGTVVSEEEYYG